MKTSVPLLLSLSLALLLATSAAADERKVVPVSNQWTVEVCDSWNCAMSKLVLANGDPYVMALPTQHDTFKWVILRRVTGGSFFAPDDVPFTLEPMDNVSDGTARYMALANEQAPMMITAPDGKVLVVYLKNPQVRRRAAGR